MISCQRHLFDLPPDVAYFNCAYMSQLLTTVAEAGVHGLARKLHSWEIAPDNFFTESEQVRRLAACLARLVQYADRYEAVARRFDMGERANFALAPAVTCTLQHILHWGVEEIASTLEGLKESRSGQQSWGWRLGRSAGKRHTIFVYALRPPLGARRGAHRRTGFRQRARELHSSDSPYLQFRVRSHFTASLSKRKGPKLEVKQCAFPPESQVGSE
jgi:hypothetical protein